MGRGIDNNDIVGSLSHTDVETAGRSGRGGGSIYNDHLRRIFVQLHLPFHIAGIAVAVSVG